MSIEVFVISPLVRYQIPRNKSFQIIASVLICCARSHSCQSDVTKNLPPTGPVTTPTMLMKFCCQTTIGSIYTCPPAAARTKLLHPP